ncbi:MAG: HoxN/HupN/NixA family nickel/cobalt transporter [Gammaproteobacteria bacterium]
MTRFRADPFDDKSERQTAKLVWLYGLLVAANVGAWAWALALFYNQPTLLGTAFLAYIFGLRHAVDADHIAAIDNVVRKLMQDGKRPLSAGFYFSLGHSTVVILAVIGIAVTATALKDELGSVKSIGSTVGTAVSAFFLIAIGIANLFILRRVRDAFARVRNGEPLEPSHPDMLVTGTGLSARLFNPLVRAVGRSWHMYPLGFLFGLGFDTATEIGLLGISAAQADNGISIWSILVFPALFTAGMALVDTTDSVLMVGAYGWAFINPIRKLWYNMTITAASVAVALFIGGIEAAGLISEKLGLEGGVWKMIADLNENLTNFGFVVIGIFIGSWIISALIYRWNRYDELTVGAG